jgi:hypothetical protein
MKKLFFLLILWVFPVFGATIPTDAVILQGMDNVTGRVKELSLPVGSSIDFGELTITVDKCLTKTPEETPENAAFLRIVQADKELFSGWMFSSNPAISAMEDPVYDVWVVSCVYETPVISETEVLPSPEPDNEEVEITDIEIED